jgi:hypothetical protein
MNYLDNLYAACLLKINRCKILKTKAALNISPMFSNEKEEGCSF